MRNPDLVVVVLDCLRAASLARLPEEPAHLPNLARLRRASVDFPRAAAVSHWTVPSHATMLTGLYPWDHGLYRGGRASLASETPRLARALGRAGYRSASFAANGLLEPSLGWLDGFGYSAWGCSAYLRSSRSARPPAERSEESVPPGLPRSTIPRFERLTYWGVVGLERFPWLLDRAARFEHRWRTGASGRPELAAWIEPALERWLGTIPASAPSFAFLNLMDAHEPYLIDRENGATPAERALAERVRQDHHGWIAGRWDPSPAESERIEALYEASVRSLDARIGRILRILEASGRWENTALLLTSDHGQSFGGPGGLYHMTGLSEELLRVPLWLRLPGSADGGRTATGWASLLDVAPTLAELGGVSIGSEGSGGRTLPTLMRSDRELPVLALGDGPTFGDSDLHLAVNARRRSDPPAVAGYLGAWKAVWALDAPAPRFFDLSDDPAAQRATEAPGPIARTLSEALGGARAKVRSLSDGGGSAATGRLRAWGYVD